MKCSSCGKPADVEVETQFRPLTARGERACDMVKRTGIRSAGVCVDCLDKGGEAFVRGDFAGDDEAEDEGKESN